MKIKKIKGYVLHHVREKREQAGIVSEKGYRGIFIMKGGGRGAGGGGVWQSTSD